MIAQRSLDILLVDDEAVFSESTRELFRAEGHRCDCARDVDEALRLAELHRYDVLVADIHMPGNADLRLLREFVERGRFVPTVLVTGYPSMETAVRAIDFPVTGYLIKPVDFDDLLARVLTASAAMEAASSKEAAHALPESGNTTVLRHHVSQLLRDLANARRETPATPPPRSFEQTLLLVLDLLEELADAWRQREHGSVPRAEPDDGLRRSLAQVLDALDAATHDATSARLQAAIRAYLDRRA
jgi:DNA-binding response OmpR family regulator